MLFANSATFVFLSLVLKELTDGALTTILSSGQTIKHVGLQLAGFLQELHHSFTSTQTLPYFFSY